MEKEKMKTLAIIILMILGLSAFAFFYGFVLLKNNYGVMDYDEYYGIGKYNQTPCKAEYLGDGWTRLSNCAVYKVNQSMLQRSKRVR